MTFQTSLANNTNTTLLTVDIFKMIMIIIYIYLRRRNVYMGSDNKLYCGSFVGVLIERFG